MRADLLEAQASVDWVWGQLPLLNQRLEAWLEANVGAPSEAGAVLPVEVRLG